MQDVEGLTLIGEFIGDQEHFVQYPQKDILWFAAVKTLTSEVTFAPTLFAKWGLK